jgi:hypothetical protein
MGLSEVLDRMKRVFSPPQPYERPPDLEHVRQVLGDQQTEIERLQQIADDEERARRFLRG